MDIDPVILYPVTDPITDEDNILEQAPNRLFTKPFLNVLISALVMCLVYSAFFPGGGMLDVVITDASNCNLNANVGFTSQGLTYFSSISSAVAAPIIINVIGIRITLGIASFLYCGLYIGIIFLQTWTIYLGSVITGIGMGLLWVITPKILTDNSTEENVQRNNSIWWCIYIFSMVIGNTADYFYLGNLTDIGTHTRLCIYMVCTLFVILAVLVGVLGYQDLDSSDETASEADELLCSKSIDHHRVTTTDHESMRQQMERNFGRYKVTLLRKEVGFVLVVLLYNSMVLAFYSMTYQTCIGNTFSDRSLIPLMSLVFGITAVISCPIFERISAKFNNRIVIIFLYIISLAAFYIAFLMLSPNATSRESNDDPTSVNPRKSLVLLIAVLVAASDTGFNIIANSTLGLLFQCDSEIGFMLLNSVMSLGTATVFFVSCYISLYALLAAMVVLCTLATICITLDAFKTGQ